MGSHMKTTIEIADPLLQEARRVAETEGTTLRSLVHEGLQLVVQKRRQRRAFRLRKASFRGKGLQPELEGAAWETLRDLAYKGRGA